MIVYEEEEYGGSAGLAFGQRQTLLAPKPKADPAFWGDAVPAAFRLEEPVTSAIVSEAITSPYDKYDPGYDAYADLGEYEGTPESMFLVEARNADEMILMKQQLERQRQDQQTIDDAGGYGTLASVMAGIASPTTLLPGFAFLKGGKAVSIASGALRGAAGAASAAAIDETLLSQSQIARPAEKTVAAVGGSVILGGMLGGGVSALSRKEFMELSKKLEDDITAPPAPIQPSKELDEYIKSLSAAEVEKPTLSELTVAGAGALAVSRASRFINPFNRLANSPFTSSREALLRGFETTIEFNLHRDGKTLGPAAETHIKLFDKYKATNISAYKDAFSAFKKNETTYGLPQRLTGKMFRERLSRALRNNDIDPEIEEVTIAAQRIRKEILDPIKDEAIATGLLPKDVAPAFAASYLHRMWDRQKMLAYPNEAMAMLEKWAGGKVDKEVARLKTIIADAEQQLAKVKATKRDTYAPALKKIEQEQKDATARGKEIAARVANLREQVTKNNEAIRKLREASQTPEIKAQIKKLQINKKKLADSRKAAIAAKKKNATEKAALTARKAKAQAEFRAARVDIVQPDKVLRNTKQLKETAYKARMELEGILDPDGGYKGAASQTAQEVYETLTGVGSETVPAWISPITRGPLKEKLLDITDNEAEFFLKNDSAEVINSYVNKMASEIALTRAFGRADMRDQLEALKNEFMDALKEAKAPKERKRLEKLYRSDKYDFESMRDILRGTFNKTDPDSWIMQGGIALRDVSYVTSMGGVVFASLGDVARHTVVNGVQRSFGDLLDNLNLAPELRKMRLEDLKDAGFGMERVLASRLMTMADINDPMARGSMLTRATGAASEVFSKATLINHWNDIQKGIAAINTQNRVLRAVTSKSPDKKELAYLRFLGIDETNQKVIAQQFAKHGGRDGRAYIAGLKQWDDTPIAREAALAFKAGLRKEADTVVITKGLADAPVYSNTPIGKMLFQFTGFLFGAHQRMLLRGMQQADIGVAMGTLMMVAMGTMIAAIKQRELELSSELSGMPLYGQRLEEWDTTKLLYEGVDRSGVLGLFGDANNRLEKLGVYGLTRALGVEETSRYANRNTLSVVLGPTAGKFESVSRIAVAPFDNQPLTDRQIKDIRSLIWGQNITGIRHIFDAAQGSIIED